MEEIIKQYPQLLTMTFPRQPDDVYTQETVLHLAVARKDHSGMHHWKSSAESTYRLNIEIMLQY